MDLLVLITASVCFRYIITDIIGNDDGIGVENLRGSGMIAGESSQAYEEIITISMVRTCIWFLWEGAHVNLLDIFSWLTFYSLAGDVSRHWNRSLPGPVGTAGDPGGELSHYPDRSRRSEQGLLIHWCINVIWINTFFSRYSCKFLFLPVRKHSALVVDVTFSALTSLYVIKGFGQRGLHLQQPAGRDPDHAQ